MLYIHTNNNNLNGRIELIDIEAEFNIDSIELKNMYYDKKSEYVLSIIEGMKDRHGDIIESKFGNTLLTNISTGCKALLLCIANHEIRAIYLDEVGNNAIKLLPFISEDIELHVITHRVLRYFPPDFICYVDNEKCTGEEITLALEEIFDMEV